MTAYDSKIFYYLISTTGDPGRDPSRPTLGAGQGPTLPSLSGLLVGPSHRGESEDKLGHTSLRGSPIRCHPQGGVGFVRDLGTGKQVSLNDKPIKGQGDVATRVSYKERR